jgi:flagellar biogenesis protein FliO
MIRIILSLTIFASVLCSPVFAQQGEEQLPVPAVSEDLWPVMMKLALAVLVVVVLIYITMLLLRKVSLGRAGILGGKGSLEVLERSYFAPKKMVCLLRVGEKVLLVGVSDNSVNLVADVSDQDLTTNDPKASKKTGAGFGSYLERAKSHLSTIVSKV